MKVLVVEDDPGSRTYLKDAVESQGHEVRTAEDGALGLSAFNEFEPDLVLTDIRMPNMDGLELLKAIRRQDFDTLVVMITAFGSEEHVLDALRNRANNYMRKPIELKELLPLVRKYATVVRERALDLELSKMFAGGEFTLRLGNQIDLIYKVADHLASQTACSIEAKDRLSVQLGLAELLWNAIEHGNLGITFEEKSEATEEGGDSLAKLYRERSEDPARAERKIQIDVKIDESGCQWVITDEGEGFDWKNLPDPTDSEGILRFHGRGIFLCRHYFDELEFLGKGNVVRVKKLASTD